MTDTVRQRSGAQGAWHRNGRRPVLVVDEAQLAGPMLLEEIRLLTNYEDRQDKRLSGEARPCAVPRS